MRDFIAPRRNKQSRNKGLTIPSPLPQQRLTASRRQTDLRNTKGFACNGKKAVPVAACARRAGRAGYHLAARIRPTSEPACRALNVIFSTFESLVERPLSHMCSLSIPPLSRPNILSGPVSPHPRSPGRPGNSYISFGLGPAPHTALANTYLSHTHMPPHTCVTHRKAV